MTRFTDRYRGYEKLAPLDFVSIMPAALAALEDDGAMPDNRQVVGHNVRYGTNGSLSVDLRTGTWCSHEHGAGGGLLDLICARTGSDRSGAVEWLRQRNLAVQGSATSPPAPAGDDDRVIRARKLMAKSMALPADADHPVMLWRGGLLTRIAPRTLRWLPAGKLPRKAAGAAGALLTPRATPDAWLSGTAGKAATGVELEYVGQDGEPVEDSGGKRKRSYGRLSGTVWSTGSCASPRVHLAEGVADALAVASMCMGEDAMSPGGTGRLPAAAEALAGLGRPIAIHADADDAGRQSAARAAAIARETGSAEVRTVSWDPDPDAALRNGAFDLPDWWDEPPGERSELTEDERAEMAAEMGLPPEASDALGGIAAFEAAVSDGDSVAARDAVADVGDRVDAATITKAKLDLLADGQPDWQPVFGAMRRTIRRVEEPPPPPPAAPALAWHGAELPRPVLSLDGRDGTLLAEGEVALLASAGGLGKSTITVGLAVAAAGDGRAFGLSVSGGPVVLASYEDVPARISARLRWYAPWDGHGSPPPAWEGLMILPSPSALWRADEDGGSCPGPDWSRFWRTVETSEAKLAVIDPASVALADVDTTQTGPVRAFMSAVSRRAEDLGCGVLIVCHDTKAARNEAAAGGLPGAGAVAGSSAWYDAARGVLYARRDDDGLLLHCLKCSYGEDGWGVRLRIRHATAAHGFLGPDPNPVEMLDRDGMVAAVKKPARHPNEGRCSAETKAGSRCVNNAVEDGLCTIHYRQAN